MGLLAAKDLPAGIVLELIRAAEAQVAVDVNPAPPAEAAPQARTGALGLGGGEQRAQGGFRTKREAQRALADALHQLNHGTYVEPSRQPLAEYLGERLLGERLRLRPGAFDARKLHVDASIAPRIGQVPLLALSRPKVRALYAEPRQPGPRGRTPTGGPSARLTSTGGRAAAATSSHAVSRRSRSTTSTGRSPGR